MLWDARQVFAQEGNVPFYDPERASWVDVNDAGEAGEEKIIDVIKKFINYTLWLLALIALGMLIYGGYMMVTAGGKEDAYKKWLKILQNAGIGLAFIAVSRLLVTFIFYVIGLIAS